MDDTLRFEPRMGWIEVSWTAEGLRTLHLFGAKPSGPEAGTAPAWVRDAAERIIRHLRGEPGELAALPVDLEGLPPFRRKVLETLRATKPGETFTYGQLARMAGSPGA